MKWIVLVSCLLEPARAKNEWMPLPFRPGDVHPGARHGQSTVIFTHLTYNQRLALIFGGVSREAQYLNDVWLFNVTDERWYQASTDGGLAQMQASRASQTHACKRVLVRDSTPDGCSDGYGMPLRRAALTAVVQRPGVDHATGLTGGPDGPPDRALQRQSDRRDDALALWRHMFAQPKPMGMKSGHEN